MPQPTHPTRPTRPHLPFRRSSVLDPLISSSKSTQWPSFTRYAVACPVFISLLGVVILSVSCYLGSLVLRAPEGLHCWNEEQQKMVKSKTPLTIVNVIRADNGVGGLRPFTLLGSPRWSVAAFSFAVLPVFLIVLACYELVRHLRNRQSNLHALWHSIIYASLWACYPFSDHFWKIDTKKMHTDVPVCRMLGVEMERLKRSKEWRVSVRNSRDGVIVGLAVVYFIYIALALIAAHLNKHTQSTPSTHGPPIQLQDVGNNRNPPPRPPRSPDLQLPHPLRQHPTDGNHNGIKRNDSATIQELESPTSPTSVAGPPLASPVPVPRMMEFEVQRPLELHTHTASDTPGLERENPFDDPVNPFVDSKLRNEHGGRDLEKVDDKV